MTSQEKRPMDPADLRQKAEALARERVARTPEDTAALSPEELRQILHELRVHQIELEMQNEELRKAQAEIEAGRDRYFDLYDLAPVGYCILSEQGLILEANLAAATLLGMTRGLPIKQPISRFILKDDQDIYYLQRKQLFDTGEPQECELRLVKPDGAFIWVHLTGTKAQAEDGTPVCHVVISDITGRKRAEGNLRESEERFHELFERAPLGYQSLDSDGRFIEVNFVWLETLGYKREEVIGKWFGDFLAPEYIQAFKERFPVFKAQGEVHSEFYLMHKDGSRRFIAFDGRIGHNADGSFKQTHCILKDETERRRAEEALRESEQRFKTIIQNLPGAVFAHDLEGRLLFVNKTASAYTSYSEQELLTMTVSDIDSGNFTKDDRHQLWHSLNVGESETIQSTHTRKNGSKYPVEVHLNAISLGNQPVILPIAIDITERKQAEQALAESEARFKALHNASFGGIAIHDQGIILECNQGLSEMTGYQHSELIGMNGLLLIAERSREAVMNNIRTGYEKPYEAFGLRKNGDEFPLQLEARNVPYKGKQVRTVEFRDITERKQAEEQLRISEEKYRNIFENMQDVYYETSLDGLILEISPSIEAISRGQYRQADLIGRQMLDFYDDAKERDRLITKLLETGSFSDCEILLRNRDGSLMPCSISAKLWRDDQGNPVKIIGSMRDITERKKAGAEREKLHAQLTQAQKMESVGRLAGGVAHDYNNMLSVILGYTEMAMEQVDPKDQLYADLEEVFNAGKRSMDITRQLLAFARKQIISPIVMDLNEAVDGMLKMLRRLIGEDIDFAWEPAIRLWPVNMDPSQLDQILANLCVNARDAISGVGKITIETENVCFDESYCAEHAGFIPGEFVMLAVSDNGCGMDKETMAQIFEPFFTTKEIGKGTGLGLPMIYGIVKQNNGFVNVYSEPGSGTTFRIYLPRHTIETDEAMAEVTPEEVAFGQGETLLLVEDEPAIIKMCQAMLEKLGYNVLIAHAPDEAVKFASEHSGIIHLLMSDVVMPGMNGRDLADKLRVIRPDIRVLFMSGYTADAIAHHGVLDTGVHFIQKPFSMKKLSVKVRDALEGGKRP